MPSTTPQAECDYLSTFNLFGGGVSVTAFLAHAIHTLPLTQIHVVANVEIADQSSGNPTGYTVPTPLNDVASGKCLANWIRFYNDQLSGVYSMHGKSFRCAAHLQNHGEVANYDNPTTARVNTAALCLHSGDKVVTAPATANGYSTPRTNAGRAAVKSRTASTAAACLAELDAHSSPYPAEYLGDFEHLPRPELACSVNSDGWMDAYSSDPAASNPTYAVDGVNTFTDLLSAATNINGDPFFWDTQANMYGNPTNYDLFSWCLSLIRLVGDFAHDDAICQPLRDVFPGILCGLYNVCVTSRDNPQPGSKAYLNDYDVASIYGDVQCPVLYPLEQPDFQDAQSTYADQFARYGVTQTGVLQNDMAALFVARGIVMLTNAFAGSPKPVEPWFPKPGHPVVFTPSATYPAGGTYTVSPAELATLLAAAKSLGVKRRAWLCPNLTPTQLDQLSDLLSGIAPPVQRRPMHNNLVIVKAAIQMCKTAMVAFVFSGDSNVTHFDDGEYHGLYKALLDSGYLPYAEPLLSAADSGDVFGLGTAVGSGVGYNHTGDVPNTRFASNSLMDTAIQNANANRNGGDYPPAELLAYMDTTGGGVGLGGFAPLNYIWMPTGQGSNYWKPVGCWMASDAGHPHPLDMTANLRAVLWRGMFPSGNSDMLESRWHLNGAIVGGSTVAIPCIGSYAVLPFEQTLPAAARNGDLQWQIFVGGSGPAFCTYLQIFNDDRVSGFCLSVFYGAGAQSSYDAANATINFPLTSKQHYLTAATYRQGSTKRIVFLKRIGPNDLAETVKLAGAPAGAASSGPVVKYNVEQEFLAWRAAWAANGNSLANFVYLIWCHTPKSSPDDPLYVDYRTAADQLVAAYPQQVAHADLSLLTTYAELSSPSVPPHYDVGGTDPNHMADKASYEIIMGRLFAAVMASGNKKPQLGISIGISVN